MMAALVSMVLLAAVLVAQRNPATQKTPPASAATSPDALLGEALHEEEVEGRLQNAIAIYQKVLKAPGVTRAQAGRAQFRIGACYERLGLGEARKAYETVVRDFADQADLVSQAKTRLARLGGGGTATTSAGPNIRQVWPDSQGGNWHTISPDGRFVSGEDKVTGDLIIRELANGNTRRLTSIAKDRWWAEWGESSRWSRDGRYLAYCWWSTKDAKVGPQSKFAIELRVADLRDGTIRVVFADAGTRVPRVLDWSPDGRSILAALHTVGAKVTSRLSWISASDGAERPLVPAGDSELDYEACVSPNGAYVVYRSSPSNSYGADTTIVIPSRGGTGKPLLPPSYTNVRPVGWTPDGEHIVFASEAGDIMAVRVVEGQAIGDPFRIRQVPGFTGLGMSSTGALFYSIVPRVMSDLYRAEIRPDFTFVGKPSKISLPSFLMNIHPSWSPDGSRLVYLASAAAERPFLTRVMSIWSADTGLTKSFSLPINFAGPFTWSADGHFVFVLGADADPMINARLRPGLYRVSADTGAVNAILAAGSDAFPKADLSKTHASLEGWSPDASIVYKAISYRDERGQLGPVSIVEHRIADHAERELYRTGKPADLGIGFAVSPDGTWLGFGVLEAVPPKRILVVIPSGGGAARTVHEFDPESSGGWGIAWSADGRSLLIVDWGYRYGRDWPVPAECWLFDMATGAEKTLSPPDEKVTQIARSPNGREIAYAVRWREKDVSVWVMENFLPPKQGKAAPPKK
jgi:Tol biopolymer transport system component